MSAMGNVKERPAAYNLDDPAEVLTLYRECHGYLRTCRRHHHGTDFEGREFAMAALEEMMKRASK